MVIRKRTPSKLIAQYPLAYASWKNAKKRCFEVTHSAYADYGGRGITMWEGWRQDFAVFVAHLGCERPSEQHSLDRINVNGNYEPGNVRWATPQEQARNRRDTMYVVRNGAKWKLVELCEAVNAEYDLVYMRLRAGYTLQEALNKPRDAKSRPIMDRILPAPKKPLLLFQTVLDVDTTWEDVADGWLPDLPARPLY